MLPYGRQNINQEDIDAVCDVLGSDFLTTGPTIEKFEKALTQHTKAKHVIACSNGTTALHLACIAAGLNENTAAIVPSLTFLATANAVRYCHADVIFCDVCPDTGLMRPEDLEQALKKAKARGKDIKAILPVHLTGQSTDLEALKSALPEDNITIIADACHALGGKYKDSPIGSCAYEDMSCFSFHPVKTIATGEGGAITTNNSEMADIMRKLRNHGMERKDALGPWYYEMHELGYNYRITDIQCALGISQLKKLEQFVQKRKKLADHYDKLFQSELPELDITPKKVEHCDPALHLYAIRLPDPRLKTHIMNSLKEKSIGTQVHYIPVHLQPYYKKLYGELALEGAEAYYHKTLSLPLFPTMKEQDVEYVVQQVKEVLNGS